MISKEQLLNIMPLSTANDLEKFTDPLNSAMVKFEINSPLRVAAFIAQIAHESSNLKYTRENLNYSVSGLMKIFPHYFTENLAIRYARNPEMIANRVYANKGGNGDEASGDGWKYRGAGLIQTTLKDNFIATGIGIGADLVNHPELLEGPLYASDSAAWYFRDHGCNSFADAGDFIMVTKRINSALLGLKERQAYYDKAKQTLGIQ